MLFALDIVIRRITEYLVSLIRPGLLLDLAQWTWPITFVDFRSAEHNITPPTPLLSSQSRLSSWSSLEDSLNDEVTNLHQRYKTIAKKNREYDLEWIRTSFLLFSLISIRKLSRLIELESNNEVKLNELINNQLSTASE